MYNLRRDSYLFRLTSISILIIALVFMFSIKSKADDGLCYAKPCEIEGKNCVCCLELPIGVIFCAPCPKIDCPPEN
jgi:hypothetical protein